MCPFGKTLSKCYRVSQEDVSGDVLPDFKGNVLPCKIQVCSPRPGSQELHVSSYNSNTFSVMCLHYSHFYFFEGLIKMV